MENTKMSAWAKGISGGLEALLAIPVLGGSIIIFSGYQVLWLAFALHLVALGVSIAKKTSFIPSVLGVITCLIAWVPFVGWFFHLVTAVVLLISAFKDGRNKRASETEMSLS